MPQLQFQGGIVGNNDLFLVYKSKAIQVLCTFQTSTPDADIAALACALGEALGLNLYGEVCLGTMCPLFQIQTILQF